MAASQPHDQSRYGGISWEELRKGQPRRAAGNTDEALLDERFASQWQETGLPNPIWKQIGTQNSPDRMLGPGSSPRPELPSRSPK